jgi:hypothetical protein
MGRRRAHSPASNGFRFKVLGSGMRGFCVGGSVWRLIHLATRSTPKKTATARGTHAIQTTSAMSHHLTRARS